MEMLNMKHNVCVTFLAALLITEISGSRDIQERDLGGIGTLFANNKQTLLNHKQNILEHKQNILNIFKATTTSTSAPSTNLAAVSANEGQAATTAAPSISGATSTPTDSSLSSGNVNNAATATATATPSTLADPASSTSAPITPSTINPPAASVRDNLPDYPAQSSFYPQLPLHYILIPIPYLPYQDPPASLYHPQHFQNPSTLYPLPYQYIPCVLSMLVLSN
uniref:Uncharacterized protein n=1 Tax=Glossina austeni TaxID=7395 RepID=A0A1A9V474_GLOAU